MKIKELFKNAKAKVSEMKVFTSIKTFFNKIFNNKTVKTATDNIKSETERTTTATKEFISTHTNITDSVSGNILHRFQEKIKRWFRKVTKNINAKSEKSKTANVGRIVIKAVCILATIAFSALVIYCIKDVFMQCLMMVATCAAIMICVESVIWVLGTAFECKI